MSREWTIRSFRSGNSIAVRLPKSMGVQEGEEMRFVQHDDGTFAFWRVSDNAALLDSLYGSMSPGFMSEGRGDVEQSERVWDDEPDQAVS